MAVAGGVSTTSPRDRSGTDDTGPGSRTRSVWLQQLVLSASVVITVLVVQALQPELFGVWTFSTGVALIIALTAAALVVPWHRVPRTAVAAIPLGDVLGIGLLAFGTDLRFGFFWAFPIIWLATYFSLVLLITALAGVGTMILVDATVNGFGPVQALRLIIVLLTLTFIGITAYMTSRQTRAFKQLLRRQATRLQGTLQRVTGQERRVSQMLNGLDTGIARLSAEGEVLALNDTYVALYGVDRDDPKRPGGAVEYAALRGDPLPDGERPFIRASRGEQFEDERVWLYDADGNWHALSVSTRRLMSSDEPPSTLLIVHDITALIEAERARERLAATVSHELRNPLTAIVGHADLALDDPTLPPKVREQIEVIAGAGERMQSLISEILASSRGVFREDAAPAVSDAARIISSSLESFRPAAAARRVTIEEDLGEGLEVVGDAFRLRQAFDNVLSNAIKYTPGGGTVRIIGDADRLGRTVVLHFADTGIGIHEDDLPRIFEPYYRARAVRESTTPGTGLGMGIVRSIVEQQGGSLTLESEVGAGTTVSITLPARADGPGAEERTA
ncbi:sensor histidine kinase [Microbacterium sp. LMI1-1-1.1]|uniref:sensor histidine kinase n=1 Tax=Microbacterium sp. LMI1-1-1.1 TaxID=3135223 RepID=UPI003465F216